ncbi:hypothetical protein C3489_08710 [Streptomyces sp. Ru71]|uniref:hypothetical protein n=1 Tax=Streptomyces sp. Ru71 TaxID=2080746 RepID=UPI000CDE0AE7|nr:hypothetical protein [Streptomyces sp. Ru71]POX55661.1 hypothetical protein C3489_08710 [Streptomyces sp. Ru71]
MRGLTEGEVSPARGSLQAVITAAAVLAALALLVSACATGGTGTRDEGPAHADSVAGAAAASPSPSPAPTLQRVDAVQLVKDDPLVSNAVKKTLQPCAGDDYPVDVSYGDLTDGAVDDVVINVLTCGDAVGVGSYVYRADGDRYQNVFQSEESPVYAEIDRGALMVTKQVYENGDQVSNPSGENVITYIWKDGRFVQDDFHHTDFGTTVDTSPTKAPAPAPAEN